MRITDIHIKNFRAFYGSHHLSLDRDGKNLMIYGENGSGKSSLFLALKTFFEAAANPVPLQKQKIKYLQESIQSKEGTIAKMSIALKNQK